MSARVIGVAAVGVLTLAAVGASAQRPVVTLATKGIAMVHREIRIEIPAGRSTHRIDLGDAIVGSVVSATEGVAVVSVERAPPFTEAEAFKASVGRTFEFIDWPRRPAARLLAIHPERWEFVDQPGQILLARPGGILWPADLVLPETGLAITLLSDRARTSVTLEYEMATGSWAAIYDLRLGRSGSMSGTAVLASGTIELDSAEVRLLAGDLGPQSKALPRLRAGSTAFEDASITTGASGSEFGNAQGGIGPLIGEANTYMAGVPGVPGAPGATSSLAGQIYLYQLSEPVDLGARSEIAVPLFSRTPAAAIRQLSLGGVLPMRGGLGSNPAEQRVPVIVSYEVRRTRGTPFGDLPLPSGVVSVTDVGPDGVSRLTGRTTIGHTAPGQPVRVTVGASFNVTATRTQTAFAITDTNQYRQPVGVEAAYRVSIQNAEDSAVVVTVYEVRAGEWQVLESSVPAERKSSTVTSFDVRVPARSEATLTYRLRVGW